MSVIAHHSQQQGSADVQVGSPSEKQRINHQHGRQQPDHSTTRPGTEKQAQAAQSKMNGPIFISGFVVEVYDYINAGLQTASLRATAHAS